MKKMRKLKTHDVSHRLTATLLSLCMVAAIIICAGVIADTNTHADLTAGLGQLANTKDTTLMTKLSDGSENTVPRIPAAIVMTDDGSNTVANGPWYVSDCAMPVQPSDHKNDWSSVVVTQYMLTVAYTASGWTDPEVLWIAVLKKYEMVGGPGNNITDSHGNVYEIVDGGISFSEEDLLNYVTSKPDSKGGGYTEEICGRAEGKAASEGKVLISFQ